jgi:hypothetical protein
VEATATLREAAERWRVAAHALVDAATMAAPTRGEYLVASELHERLDQQTDEHLENLLDASDAMLAEIAGQVAEDDGARAMSTELFVANLTVSDALVAAAGEPDDVQVELRLPAPNAFPAYIWHNEIEASAAVFMGLPTIRGSQLSFQPQLDDDITELADATGTQAVELAKSSLFTYAATSLFEGLDSVLNGTAKDLFDKVRRTIGGAFAFLKNKATKLVQWVVEHVIDLLPGWLRDKVTDAIRTLTDHVADEIPHVVGIGLADLLGANDTRSGWQDADDAHRQQGLDHLHGATDSDLDRLKKVGKTRTFVNRWGGKVILDVARKLGPEAEIAYFAVVACVFVFIGAQLRDGLDRIERLVR